MIRPAGSVFLVLLAIGALLGTMAGPVAAQKQEVVSVARIAGDNRFLTAIGIAQYAFAEATHVVLAAGDDPATMLLATHHAGRTHDPLLLTDGRRVPAEVLDEMERLGVQRVTVVGGPNQVGESVLDQLERLGLQTVRVHDQDLPGTATLLADAALEDGDRPEIMVLIGLDPASPELGWQYGLLGASLAGALDVPLLVARPDALPAATRTILEDHPPERVVVVGDTSTVDGDVTRQVQSLAIPLDRISGQTIVEASVEAALSMQRFAPSAPSGSVGTVFVTGRGLYPDAIPAAAAQAAVGGMLLLIDRQDDEFNAPVRALLSTTELDQMIVVGGFGGVSRRTAVGLSRTVHGSLLVTKAAPPPSRTSGGDTVLVVVGLGALLLSERRRDRGPAAEQHESADDLQSAQHEEGSDGHHEPGRPRLPHEERATAVE